MILKILNELRGTSSRLEKEAILKRERSNVLLKRVLVCALDPMRNYYIKKIPKYQRNAGKGIDLIFALDTLNDLRFRNITGNAAIDFLRGTLEALNGDDAEVLECVIEHDLRCGVSEKTVNKIWPKLIMEYPVMLCHQYNDKTIRNITFPAMVQLKLDGMRFNAICRRGQVEFRTRNGKEIDLRGYLADQFKELAGNHDVVFDGELLVWDEDRYQYLPRQTSNGILSKSLKGTISVEECSRVGATVWDMIPYTAFEQGVHDCPYSARFESLREAVDQLGSENIKVVWTEVVNDIQAAEDIFKKFLGEGQEGIILKDCGSSWEGKRVNHQLKFKGELECDLIVVGWEEGTGKNVGRLGALVCESSDGVVRVSIGSGFTDQDRDTISFDSLGKIVAVKYNARIKDIKSGQESLFLPIFVEVREDKDRADSSKEIK